MGITKDDVIVFLDKLQPEDYNSLIENTKQARADRGRNLAKNKVEYSRIVKTLANVRHGVRFGIKKDLVLEVNGEMYPDENGEVELAELEIILTEDNADPAFKKVLENLENHLLENAEFSINDPDHPIPEINVLRQEMANAVKALQNEADDLEGRMVALGQPGLAAEAEDRRRRAADLYPGRPAETEPHESFWDSVVREAFKMEEQSKDPIGEVVAQWPMGETACEGHKEFNVAYTSPAARAIKS